MNKDLLERLEDIAGDLYGYAAEYDQLLSVHAAEGENHYLTAYNAIITLIGE